MSNTRVFQDHKVIVSGGGSPPVAARQLHKIILVSQGESPAAAIQVHRVLLFTPSGAPQGAVRVGEAEVSGIFLGEQPIQRVYSGDKLTFTA